MLSWLNTEAPRVLQYSIIFRLCQLNYQHLLPPAMQMQILGRGSSMVNFILSIIWCSWILSVVVKSEDSYSPQERISLKAFRELVKDDLTQSYMFENKYLIRWLRARNLNLEEAEEMIKNNFVWRKEKKIDGILNEDWSRFEAEYPFNFKSRDYEGRPALSTRLGTLNIRRLILLGERERIRRYLIYGLEKAVSNIHKVSNETGKEFVGTHLLFNMAGYDIRTQACLQCVSGWLNLVNIYENYYPHLGETLIVVNSPRLFETLYALIKPLVSQRTRNTLHVFGLNKEEWKAALLKIYSLDQLTAEFGGTLKVKVTM